MRISQLNVGMGRSFGSWFFFWAIKHGLRVETIIHWSTLHYISNLTLVNSSSIWIGHSNPRSDRIAGLVERVDKERYIEYYLQVAVFGWPEKMLSHEKYLSFLLILFGIFSPNPRIVLWYRFCTFSFHLS